MGKPGVPYTRSRLAADQEGATHCYYCREAWTDMRPPTLDHVVPLSQGGKIKNGYVISCQTCNSCRGPAPFDLYRRASETEWVNAKRERRQYRRPKYRKQDDGSYIITVGQDTVWTG